MAIMVRNKIAPTATANRARGSERGRSTASPMITMPSPRINEPIPMVTSAKP